MYDKFEEEDSSWSFAIGLLVGAVVGAAVASLFTPRSGAQNREAVIERGLVLRGRVTDASDTVTTRVRDTASTVRGGAERIGAAAGATVERVQEVANTAASTVKDVASTAAERAQTIAGTATEKVQDAANTAAAAVSEVAGTVSERAQSVAGTVSERAQGVASKVQGAAGAAAERARQATGRETVDEFAIPAATAGLDEFAKPATTTGLDEFGSVVGETTGAIAPLDVDAIMGLDADETAPPDVDAIAPLEIDATAPLDADAIEPPHVAVFDTAAGSTTRPAGEEASGQPVARYDAEEIRSTAVDTGVPEAPTALPDRPEPEQLETLASIDTFEGATSSTTALDGDLATETLPPLADEPMDLELGSDNAVFEAQAELSSSDQFVVDEQAAPLGETDGTTKDEDQRSA